MEAKKLIYLDGSTLYAYNGVYIGDVFAKEDGFYDFWPKTCGGFWSSYMLRAIADMLDEMNKPLKEEINKFLEEANGANC